MAAQDATQASIEALENAMPKVLEGMLQNLIPTILGTDPVLAGLLPQLSDTAQLDQVVQDLAIAVRSSHTEVAVRPSLAMLTLPRELRTGQQCLLHLPWQVKQLRSLLI